MRLFPILSLLCLASLPALAAVEGPGRTQYVQVAPREGDLDIDGRLDEPAWQRAPVFTDFVQRFPTAGAPPSERTELRVLYDSKNLYVGIICRDSEPARIDRRLGRRDADLFTDAVQVIIDAAHDHRTAYLFYLSAGGVHGDGLFFDDRNFTKDWDGVWDGASGRLEDGWVAELAIPLSLLRFPAADVQTWGFDVRRDIARKNEEIDSVDNPRTSNANVSRFGHLTGMRALVPERAFELSPYVAVRGVGQPQFSDASRPTPRLLNPSADVGLDARFNLTSDVSLTATLNPEFGQVEADQLILNLSTFEPFFPEKRPFFQQGLELFQPVGGGGGPTNQTLFYSRRIGLTEPILGAVKVTGNAASNVEVGLLDAVVTGAAQPEGASEEDPSTRFRLRPERPLHFGLERELPLSVRSPTNYFAGVARLGLGGSSRVGATVAAATPLAPRCREDQAARDAPPPECLTLGGNAAALDFDLKSADSTYGILGQVTGSQVVAGPPERTLRDGTVLHRGDTGAGAFVRAGKFGGEGFRWEARYDWTHPTLELNAAGFQRTQNEHGPQVWLRYQRANGWGPFKQAYLNLGGFTNWSSDGRGITRSRGLNLNGQFQLPSFDTVGFELGKNLPRYDVREIGRTGVPLARAAEDFYVLYGNTNPNRPIALAAFGAVGYHHAAGPTPGQWGWGTEGSVEVRPHPALETRLSVAADYTPHGPRYVDTLEDGRFLLGDLRSYFLSTTLRQQWVLRPHLTLQGYAQLFTAYGRYDRYYEGFSDAGRRPIELGALVPAAAGAQQDFYETALNLNVVLRWEYTPGSTLYVVYSRGQAGLPFPDDRAPPATLAPRQLLQGPATDAVLVKWTYYLKL